MSWEVYDNLAKEFWGTFETEKEAYESIRESVVQQIKMEIEECNDDEKHADLLDDLSYFKGDCFSISGNRYCNFDVYEVKDDEK